MTTITFDVVAFRASYPAFASLTLYPTIKLQIYWDTAINYISDQNSNCGMLTGGAQVLALNLLTAHLAALFDMIAAGQTPGQVQSSTIDKISVTLKTAPERTQWQWWLGLTPYGQQLLALLQIKAVGGMYVGGLPELSAFRKVGGVF